MLKPDRSQLTREDYEYLTWSELAQLGHRHSVRTIQHRVENMGMHPYDAVHTPKLRKPSAKKMVSANVIPIRPDKPAIKPKLQASPADVLKAFNTTTNSQRRLAAMPWR